MRILAGQPRRLIVVGAFSVLALGGRCPEPLLSREGDGIYIFTHAHYRGEWAVLDSDVPNLREKYLDQYRPWSDLISSIRISPGWSGTAYTDINFQGEPLSLTSDIPDLQRLPGPCGGGRQGFNDCIASVRIVRP